MKSDHIKRMIILTGENIKRLSLFYNVAVLVIETDLSLT